MANTKFDSIQNEHIVYYHKNIVDGVEVKQCKGNPHDFKSHVHAELSIGIILSGSTELVLSDRTLQFNAGDGVIIPPFVSHRCSPQDIRKWEYVMLYIHPDRYKDVGCFHEARKIEGGTVHRLTGYIARLLAQENPDALETTLMDLLVALGETATQDAENASAIAQVRRYIAEHLYEPVALEQLERVSGLNKFTLIRNFKKTYVTTPASYHLQCRVAEAKQRLTAGSDVLTLCSELQFYDQAHFIREFRKMYGITPSVYQKQIQK